MSQSHPSRAPDRRSPPDGLPNGCLILDLSMYEDNRGCFTELLRQSWIPHFQPNQINFVRSAPNVLRGLHVHRYHSDFLVFVAGTAIIALKDLRHKSSSFMQGGLFTFSANNLQGIFIPPGVAHAFYFPDSGAHLYAVDRYFDGSDEYGCMFNDPDLHLPWLCSAPLLSERDQKLPSLTALLSEIERWQ
jgi:dTDP-4-dehydrorhamnose 3,5-epimerase